MKTIFGQSFMLAAVCCFAFNGTASANTTVEGVVLPPQKEAEAMVLLLTGNFDGKGKVPATLTTVKETLLGLGLGQAGDELIDAADVACVVSLSFEQGFKIGEWTSPISCVLLGDERLFLPMQMSDY